MTATTNGQTKKTTVVDSLRKADERWARRHSDQPAPSEYLEHLACSLPAAAVASNSDAAPSVTDAEVARLREQVVAAENNAAARLAERNEARAEVEQLLQQIQAEQRETNRATGALESARRERDQLSEQLASVRDETNREPVNEAEEIRHQAKLIKELRADYDALVVDNKDMADRLAAAQAQRDSVTDHRCVWQWHGPDEPVKPCTCGRHAPRYELREVS